MLNSDPDKNWIAWLFVCAFALVVVWEFWPYIVATFVLYAIAKGFCSQRHHNNHSNRKRCPRCRRRW